jgi:hypothetical protein
MLYNVTNQKENRSITVEARSKSHAMNLARVQEQWTNYGTRRHTGEYRNYKIEKAN